MIVVLYLSCIRHIILIFLPTHDSAVDGYVIFLVSCLGLSLETVAFYHHVSIFIARQLEVLHQGAGAKLRVI